MGSALVVLSAGIILLLGTIHLIYTFTGSKLTPRDSALRESMSAISPVITRQTTMWKAWVGFNASHSLGAILFGLVYGYLAIAHPELLFRSPFLLIVGLGMLASYVVLAKLYWFSIPFIGISVATATYFAAVAWAFVAV
jgi:hypothetical protein